MKNRRNYYRILHVQPDAPVEVIRSSYRTIMQKLRAHPDLGGDDWNATLINEAYAVVTDPQRRAEYDTLLNRPARQPVSEPPDRQDQANQPFSQPGASTGHVRCSFCHALQRRSGVYRADGRCGRCSSPLTPVVPLVLEHSCRRAIARMEAHSQVRMFSQWPQACPHRGTITDLSLNGLGVRSAVALPAATVIKLDSKLLCATARIVTCLPQHGAGGHFYQIGVAFVTLEFTEPCGSFLSART